MAISEAERNLASSEQRTRLYRLAQRVEIVDEPKADEKMPSDIRLPVKDRPILIAAINGRCTHLLTGDRKHFGAYFGQSIRGVRLMTVRDYLSGRAGAAQL